MERKYQLDTEENRLFLAEIRQNLLDFGRKFPSPGGGSYYLGDDGTPWPEKGRETWITSRMTHVYSIGTMLGDIPSAPLVDAALKGLSTTCASGTRTKACLWTPGTPVLPPWTATGVSTPTCTQ